MRRIRLYLFCGIGLLAVLGAGVALGTALAPRSTSAQATHSQPASESEWDDEESQDGTILVKTIRPKRDASFVIAVQQLASVEAYFQQDLRARVAGVVKYVQKDVNDRVRKGELLIEIDVPDLVHEVAQKETVIAQRQRELALAKAQVRFALASVSLARHNVEQSKSEAVRTEATRDFRKKRLARFVKLRNEKAVNESVVDEEERDYLAAVAACESARLGIHKAEADLEEKQASLEAALADVELKEAMIDVARKDRDKTQALANYGRIYAEFDGVVTSRKVNIGTFVQNSATAHTEPLMTVSRTDIVTVVTKIPDNAATAITRNADAVIQIDELPGVIIRGKVTRYSPSIDSKDRTMRVEVDLFNGNEVRYQRFVGRTVSSFLSPLAGSHPSEVVTLMGSNRYLDSQRRKSSEDPVPVLPKISGMGAGEKRLLPGMSGYMRLSLRKFQNAYLLPSSAVFNRGGKPYILIVKDEAAHLVPVRVQMNDGKLAKVNVIINERNPQVGQREMVHDLTGEEEIVISRQAEISEGQAVRTTLGNW
jgi:multidrug resistance efflux pump